MHQNVETKKGQLKTATKEYNRGWKTVTDGKKLKLAKNEHRYAKEDLTKAKILNKLSDKPKSEKQLKWEQKYKEKGMTDNDAAVAAYQRIRTTNILKVTGAVAVTALTAYAAYKIHDDRVDKIIKSGTNLQQITSDGSIGVRDAFYSAGGKMDKMKYKGMYGSVLKERGPVYGKNISVLGNIKQASDKNAHKVLAEMAAKDPEFLKSLKGEMSNQSKLGFDTYYNKMKKAKQSLDSGKVDKNTYEVFNALLVDHSPGMQKITDSYYKTMASKGYNAIRDINDKKYSGYNTNNPIITFGAKGLIKVTDVKKLTDEEISKADTLSMVYSTGSAMVKSGAQAAGVILSIKGGEKIVKAKVDNKMVDKYKKEHPNTNKNYKEIVRMLERDKLKGGFSLG